MYSEQTVLTNKLVTLTILFLQCEGHKNEYLIQHIKIINLIGQQGIYASVYITMCLYISGHWPLVCNHLIASVYTYFIFLFTEFNDYIPLISEELIFSSGDIERCVNITLLGDESFEGQEYFIVSGSSQQDVIFTGNVTVILDDNDGMELLKYTLVYIDS